MEVINDNTAMLSNFEVLNFLSKSQLQSKGKRPNGRGQNLATITYETTEYLSKSPASVQNPECIEKFLKALTPFKLTKAEKLQLLDLRPKSQVELQLMIEEIDERFTEERIAQLLEVVMTELPDPSGSSEKLMDTSDSCSRDTDHKTV